MLAYVGCSSLFFLQASITRSKCVLPFFTEDERSVTRTSHSAINAPLAVLATVNECPVPRSFQQLDTSVELQRCNLLGQPLSAHLSPGLLARLPTHSKSCNSRTDACTHWLPRVLPSSNHYVLEVLSFCTVDGRPIPRASCATIDVILALLARVDECPVSHSFIQFNTFIELQSCLSFASVKLPRHFLCSPLALL